MAARELRVRVDAWPFRGRFAISRGARSEARVVVAEIFEDGSRGRGECVPYARYGESVEAVVAELRSRGREVSAGLSREGLADALAPGAARNALDCALWDLEAKRSGTPVSNRASNICVAISLCPETTAQYSASTLAKEGLAWALYAGAANAAACCKRSGGVRASRPMRV